MPLTRSLVSCVQNTSFGGGRQRRRIDARVGTGATVEIVRLSANEQFPQLMPSLYAGELASCRLPFGSIDAMWLALGALANNKTPALHGKQILSLPVAASGGRIVAVSGSSLAALGREEERAPSKTSPEATGLQLNLFIMSINPRQTY